MHPVLDQHEHFLTKVVVVCRVDHTLFGLIQGHSYLVYFFAASTFTRILCGKIVFKRNHGYHHHHQSEHYSTVKCTLPWFI